MIAGPPDPVKALEDLARIDLETSTLPEVLQRVANATKSLLPHAAEVSVTLIDRDIPTTAAQTSPVAQELDEVQYAAQSGPCLEAARDQRVITVYDTGHGDEHWPEFAAAAHTRGVASTVAVGMHVRDHATGALNVYLNARGGLEHDEGDLLITFAQYAAVALSNAHLQAATAALAQQMERAMQSRAVIEQAKGIVMVQRSVGAEDAFAILARASQSMNLKLRDIAQNVVDSTAHT